MRAPRSLALLAIIAALAACGDANPLREVIEPASPRERYARALGAAGLDSTALGRDWTAAGEGALRASHPVALPFREAGYFAPEQPAAAAWRFALRRGQRLVVAVALDGAAPGALFADLFELPADSAGEPERVESAGEGAAGLEHEARRDGEYLLRIQPELLRGGRWTLTVEATASLAFPVEGRDSRAVRSFFGAARDAGRRVHQGIDIFAPRGTPVLAASDGVARASTNALGGKVVWVRDVSRGVSLYYAHLDSQLVGSGALVRAGDTLGLVGNTGNARTTAPHLHFGIYRRGEGALDPWPWVHVPRERPAPVGRDTAALGAWRRVSRREAALRAGPDGGASRIAPLARHAPVRVLGVAGGWVRVRLPDGASGYLAAAALAPADAPIRTARPRTAVALREQPAARAAVVDSLGAGARLPVLGEFGGFALVRTAEGRTGWVEALR